MSPYLKFVLSVPHLSTLGRVLAVCIAHRSNEIGQAALRMSEMLSWCDCTEMQLQKALFELEAEEVARAYVQACPAGDDQTISWRVVLPEETFPYRALPKRDPKRDAVLSKTDYRCFYCGDDEGPLQLDHKHPSSRGGGDANENLIGACASCNAQKKDRTVEEYRALLSYKTKSDVSQIIFFGESAA